MKKLMLTTIMAILAMPVYAGEVPLYLSIGAGVTSTRDADWSSGALGGSIGIDSTANLAGAVGGEITKNVRGEMEISYRNADLSDISLDGVGSASLDGEVKTTAFLVNGYYDFLEGHKFRPFVSAGAGVAHHSGQIDAVGGLGTPGTDASDTVFAYQVGAGAGYDVGTATTVWGGARYLGTSDADFDGVNAEYGASEIRAGLRFSF